MKVHLAYSPQATLITNRLPSNEGRQILVDLLIEAFGLHQSCTVFKVEPAEFSSLITFHSPEYVKALLASSNKSGIIENFGSDSIQLNARTLLEFGLTHDCPVFPELSDYVRYVAGASLKAADLLQSARKKGQEQTVAINWYGGRHHCGRSRAAGFCYVNDVVLAIIRLRKSFRRIFYLDLDLHHGDGVESAFKFSKNVVTCSVHRHGPGFYPGTGSVSTLGAYNVPTNRGLGDAALKSIMDSYIQPLIEREAPEVIVVQCGADGLASDPNAEWNLTLKGLAQVITNIITSNKACHVLLLGGGGYNHRDTARLWSYITKTIVGDSTEWVEIPQHRNLEDFADDRFLFWTEAVLHAKPGRRDENTPVEFSNFLIT